MGSFAAEGDEGEELVFDLGGNAAEWVVAADGTGKAEGGSADRPADNKATYRAADAAYTGFRVVHIAPPPKPAPTQNLRSRQRPHHPRSSPALGQIGPCGEGLARHTLDA